VRIAGSRPNRVVSPIVNREVVPELICLKKLRTVPEYLYGERLILKEPGCSLIGAEEVQLSKRVFPMGGEKRQLPVS